MPNYHFRCATGCSFDALFSMADVPREMDCRLCGATAQRQHTAPHLSGAAGAAYGLIDGAARSAHEPDVVSNLPSAGPARRAPVTHNPLHAKLPRY